MTTPDLDDVVLLPKSIVKNGVIFYRENGKRVTNIPRTVELHSPDGYEWGYGGSGPADFALNILETALQSIRYDGPRTKLLSGDMVFDLAEKLHQDFKSKFIATADQEGNNHIPYDSVINFLVMGSL
jgi:hypothetical protein